MKNNILHSWNAGLVRRWHCNPQLNDTVDYDCGHQNRCAILMLHFWPDCTREQLIDILTHDQGEIDAGDMAYPIKRKHPEFSALLHSVEMQSIIDQDLPLFDLSRDADDHRRWIDMLDSYCWMIRNKPSMRHKQEWKVQRDMLFSNANTFNVYDKFSDFFGALEEFYID